MEDKYAIGSLAFAGVVALWGSAGMISVSTRILSSLNPSVKFPLFDSKICNCETGNR